MSSNRILSRFLEKTLKLMLSFRHASKFLILRFRLFCVARCRNGWKSWRATILALWSRSPNTELCGGGVIGGKTGKSETARSLVFGHKAISMVRFPHLLNQFLAKSPRGESQEWRKRKKASKMYDILDRSNNFCYCCPAGTRIILASLLHHSLDRQECRNLHTNACHQHHRYIFLIYPNSTHIFRRCPEIPFLLRSIIRMAILIPWLLEIRNLMGNMHSFVEHLLLSISFRSPWTFVVILVDYPAKDVKVAPLILLHFTP
jgi:hypothetical protein